MLTNGLLSAFTRTPRKSKTCSWNTLLNVTYFFCRSKIIYCSLLLHLNDNESKKQVSKLEIVYLVELAFGDVNYLIIWYLRKNSNNNIRTSLKVGIFEYSTIWCPPISISSFHFISFISNLYFLLTEICARNRNEERSNGEEFFQINSNTAASYADASVKCAPFPAKTNPTVLDVHAFEQLKTQLKGTGDSWIFWWHISSTDPYPSFKGVALAVRHPVAVEAGLSLHIELIQQGIKVLHKSILLISGWHIGK